MTKRAYSIFAVVSIVFLGVVRFIVMRFPPDVQVARSTISSILMVLILLFSLKYKDRENSQGKTFLIIWVLVFLFTFGPMLLMKVIN